MKAPARGRDRLFSFVILGALALLPPSLSAQSLTAGSLRGQVEGDDGLVLSDASVTLEASSGGTVLLLETDFGGAFAVPLLSPGSYQILVEQVGYQPVRRLGVIITAGQRTSVRIVLERRPPPITSVKEISGEVAQTGIGHPRTVADVELHSLDQWRAASDGTRGTTSFVGSFDDRVGLGIASLGLPGRHSRLLVDGMPEVLLRHPALAGEPLSSEAFPRAASTQLNILSAGLDNEWRGTPGSVLSLMSRRGSNRVEFEPYASASTSSAGFPTELNPGDSSATSFQVGAVVAGAIVPDTAHFLLQGQYQSIELPSAQPWTRETDSFGGATVGLRNTIRGIASDSFATAVDGAVAPVLRTWKGGNGLARVDWKLSPTQTLMARIAVADWEEKAPRLGSESSNNAGAGLDGTDISGGFTLTSTGASTSNEFRTGFSSARRTWTGAGLPATIITGSGVAFGDPGVLPGRFEERAVDISDAVQIRAGDHQIKFGGSARLTRYEQDYRFGSSGIFHFGNLDQFGGGLGAFYQASGPGAPVSFNSTEVGLFLQDLWQATPEIQLLYGLRYETQILPTGELAGNTAWETASGIVTNGVPKDRKGVSPHGAIVWDVQNRGEWILRAGGGLDQGRLDPSTFAEAMAYDGTVTIRRGLGALGSWPTAPSTTLAPSVGPALTFFQDSAYRAPRTLKGEVTITRVVPGGLSVSLAGRFAHTDYLLRREDLNRQPTPLAATSNGRPVYGSLVQQGSLIQAATQSNRRFDAFDMVYGLTPTGASDYYEFTASLERRMRQGVTLLASYTYSKTEDNLVGYLSGDPADRLSPFPDGLNGRDWTDGRSDFDVPHRASATLRFESTGKNPVILSARGRVQSGLPFTPGFQPGVDVNGDGSGGNDPIFIDQSVTGLRTLLAANSCELGSGFAARNSCRGETQYGVDLSLAVGLPISTAGRHVFLTVDAFNVTASQAGPIDRAAVMIDPTGSLPPAGSGTIALPLIANPRFGTILSRRDDPRLLRVGLRIN